MSSIAIAEEGAPSAEAQSTESASDQSEAKRPVKKTKGGKANREKDADGSEAPDRFKADTGIKSQYKLNGQPLEVDPD